MKIEKTKYQLYLRKIGNKRWLKEGIPSSYRIIRKRYKRYGKDKIHDVRMKAIN